MSAFVQLPLEEYNKLKQQAEDKNIPVEIESFYRVEDPYGGNIIVDAAKININMRELKLQICRQNDINPNRVTVKFY